MRHRYKKSPFRTLQLWCLYKSSFPATKIHRFCTILHYYRPCLQFCCDLSLVRITKSEKTCQKEIACQNRCRFINFLWVFPSNFIKHAILSWIYVPHSDNNNSSGHFATVAIWSMEKPDASTRSTQFGWMGSRYSRLYFWDLCLSWMGLLGWIFSPRQFYGLETDFCWKWNWDQVCISSLILWRMNHHVTWWYIHYLT